MVVTSPRLLSPQLTPHGHLRTVADDTASPLSPDIAKALDDAFAHSSGNGLLYLVTALPDRALPPDWAWWRRFAARFVAAACAGEAMAAELADGSTLEE